MRMRTSAIQANDSANSPLSAISERVVRRLVSSHRAAMLQLKKAAHSTARRPGPVYESCHHNAQSATSAMMNSNRDAARAPTNEDHSQPAASRISDSAAADHHAGSHSTASSSTAATNAAEMMRVPVMRPAAALWQSVRNGVGAKRRTAALPRIRSG